MSGLESSGVSNWKEIVMESTLHGSHQAVYRQLFQHPAPRNLEWRKVTAMLKTIPDLQAEENGRGDMKLVRNGQTLTLHAPHSKDFSDIEEVMKLRHFLESPAAPAASPAAGGQVVLVLIDHREARIFDTEMDGTIPKQIKPYDPFGFGLHVRHHADGFDGKRPQELKSYYEAVIKTIEGAKEILLFGAGVGGSSAVEHLLQELREQHHDLVGKVVLVLRVDEHHLTEDELLAKAREFYAARADGNP
jgi:hypothetical protein